LLYQQQNNKVQHGTRHIELNEWMDGCVLQRVKCMRSGQISKMQLQSSKVQMIGRGWWCKYNTNNQPKLHTMPIHFVRIELKNENETRFTIKSKRKERTTHTQRTLILTTATV
jgi:hypothetical protein